MIPDFEWPRCPRCGEWVDVKEYGGGWHAECGCPYDWAKYGPDPISALRAFAEMIEEGDHE